MNLIEYVSLEREHPLDPYHEVDALVLCEATYFPYELLVEQLKNGPLYMKELNIELFSNSTNNPLNENYISLLTEIKQAPYFGELKVLDFKSEFNVESQHQFAAMTYLVNNETLFIAFRGTDFSTVGWKEDFNMSFSKEIPARNSAIQYVNRMLSLFDYPVVIGGHSKGGNLAVYASCLCDIDYQLRIEKIFNFDGPGFLPEFTEREEYISNLHKIDKFVPQSALVGLLMESKEKTTVVASNTISFFQHDPFTWKIENNQFVDKKAPTSLSIHFSLSLKEWLKNIDYEKRKYLVDAIYDGLTSLNITDFEDISQFNFSTIQHAIEQYKESDDEFKEFLKEIMSSFIKSFFEFKSKNKENQEN